MASSRVGTSTRVDIPGVNFPEQLFYDRNQECQRLAGSGLRRGEYVLAGERLRDGSGLDWGGDNKFSVRQSLLGIRGER